MTRTALLLALCLVSTGCTKRPELPVIAAPGSEGLSGLTRDGAGQLWSLPERQPWLLRINGLNAAQVPFTGVPKDTDVESITWLGGTRFAAGTESGDESRTGDLILILEVGERAEIVDRFEMPYAPWGVKAEVNRGIEGLCHADGHMLTGVELIRERDGHRFAPVGRYDMAQKTWTGFWVRLTSERGKLSAMDCRKEGDEIQVVAIERHLGISRLLRFALPVAGPGADIVPTLHRDVAKTIHPDDNFEGVVWNEDGQFTLINDNHYGRVTGPNHLVVTP